MDYEKDKAYKKGKFNNNIYNSIFNNRFDINLTYIGYKENNQIIIKKE